MKKTLKNFNIPSIKYVINYLKDKRKFLFFIYLFCVVEILCSILATFGTKGLIDAVLFKNENQFIVFLLMYCLSHVLWWCYSPIASYIATKISKQSFLKLKMEISTKIIHSPQSEVDKRTVAEWISVFTNDIQGFVNIADGYFFNIIRSITGGLTGLILVLILNPLFSVIMFIIGLISFLISSKISQDIERKSTKILNQKSKINTSVHEIIRAAKHIRLLGTEQHELNRFKEQTQLEREKMIDLGGSKAKLNASLLAINMLANISIIIIGAVFVHYKYATWGEVIAIRSLKGAAFDMLFIESLKYLSETQAFVAGIKRTQDILEFSTEEQCTPVYNANEKNALELVNTRFSYQENINVISNFNLSLVKNKLTVLVGESGKGKSTIMKLILGLYKLKEGEILFNKDFDYFTHVRELTAYVSQEPYLFRGTIKDNITAGRETISLNEIVSAAKLAGAHDFIMSKKDQYETLLLDNGNGLSGGEKQRLSLTRALLKNAPILLLDEVTSALDKENESKIIETILKIKETKTVLLITHNRELLKYADKVIEM